MRRKTINKINAESDNREELIAYGCRIQELKPWHWRITRPDYDVAIDVWPTAHKVWIVGSNRKAEIYSNMFEKVMEIFDKYMP